MSILLLSSQAMAQFIAPIRYNEGPGVKLTDSLVFHPGAEIEGRYDSNALYEESNLSGAGYMRFIGHLDLATLSPQRLTDGEGKVALQTVDFRGKTAIAFREYFSSNDNVKAQRALEVDAGLRLALFPMSVFSFAVNDDFARTVQGRGGETKDLFTRDTNRANLQFTLAPGGRRLLFGLGYSLGVDIFEDSNMAFANKLHHEINFSTKWKLFIKTALALEVIQQFVSYYDKNDASNEGYPNNDSKPFRAYFGLTGLITPILSTVLKVGYGNGIYSDGNSFNSVLVIAELGFQFGPLARLKFGFERSFQDSMFANYYTDNQIYLGYDHFVANRVLLHLRGDYRYRSYDGFPAGRNISELTQNVVTLSAGADYQIQEWLYVGLGYDLQLQDVISGPSAVSGIFANSFTKHQVVGKIGVSY